MQEYLLRQSVLYEIASSHRFLRNMNNSKESYGDGKWIKRITFNQIKKPRWLDYTTDLG